MKLIIISTLLLLICSVSSALVNPIDAVGTTLPSLTTMLQYRVFNDLMKQSGQFFPYNFTTNGRIWGGFNLNYTKNIIQQYPSNLPTNVMAVSEIIFFDPSIDGNLIGKNFSVSFSGTGKISIYQKNILNVTLTGSGNFTLNYINQSLFVYIYTTDSTNPVRNIKIIPTELGANPPTFTSNFLYYLKPFNLIRTCFWQNQNLYRTSAPQSWNNRTDLTSSSQILAGVAL
jgi:hypothetical protein